jgi:Fe-S-cluster containining protein
MIACPLLKNDLCIAYEGRPFVCRTTYSSGVPDQCHPHRFNAANMVPRSKELHKFQDLEKTIVGKFKLKSGVVPLALALLLGERISKNELELDKGDSAILKEYLEAWVI